MYSNDNHFTKEPYEDNGRCKIHPLSEEGKEAYLSKDSYNYNFIRTKKNPELLKEIQEEIKNISQGEIKYKFGGYGAFDSFQNARVIYTKMEEDDSYNKLEQIIDLVIKKLLKEGL